jgi:hypothetical protein
MCPHPSAAEVRNDHSDLRMNEKRGQVTKRGLIGAWLFVLFFLSACLHPDHGFAALAITRAH